MEPPVPSDVRRLLDRVSALNQWERSQLGRALRQLGWTYFEIGNVIPAAKSTIAGWCRDIVLTQAQSDAIHARTASRRGIPRDTQRKRRKERKSIVEKASREALGKLNDPAWIAGVMLYWGEGFKTENVLGLANSDPDLVRLFMSWSRTYHDPRIAFRAKLNLHASNDEATAIAFWCEALAIEPADFNKTFIKPEGTGHRRNHLAHGVIQVRARQSTDHFLTTTGWIEGLRLGWKCLSQND